ncbi:MAG: beta-lactamase family protein [Cyclobacteriaceae bacterium]|nr:beta-lactamase family protein [Cyclobacteriaceae bacterium]
MKHLLLFCIGCALFFTAHAQSADTISRIDEIFTHWNNATPGGSVLVSRNGSVIYHKAFGLADLEHNVPNTTETIFEGGSVSKQFTAASLLLLATEGKLSTQDDVRKYIPELPVYDAPVTIQHLLNHTSGLKDWGSIGSLTGWPRTTRVYTQELALDIICKQRSLNFTPGTEYSYSNSNYTLLVTIVERVSGMSLAEFTRTRFFEPLGMTHTQWRDNFREIIPNRSVAYSKTISGYEQMMPFENIHGHGGLLTTTGDLMKWNALLQTHAIGGDALYAMRVQQGQLKNRKTIYYAGGLNIGTFNQYTEISHSGSTAGYRAWLAYYPDKKITIAILSNDANGNVVASGKKIAEIVLGKSESKMQKPATLELPEPDLKKFTGTYRSIRNFDVFTLSLRDKKLYWNHMALMPSHRDTLFYNDLKWAYVKPGRVLVRTPQDTSLYRQVNPADSTQRYLQALAGRFVSKEADTEFTVSVKGNEVWISRKPATAYKLTPLYYDGYRGSEFDLLEFKRDRKGTVTGFEINLSRAERVPFTKVTQTR